jgi:tetratricopeptide (TPR) repeat protein
MFGKQKSQLCRIIAPRTLERWISGLLAVCMVASAHAASPDTQMAQLTDTVARHTADVRAVEQQLLPHTDTRVAVEFAIATPKTLLVDSLEIYLDEQLVASHRYTEKDREALAQGQTLPLYQGNLTSGSHHLKTVVNARADNNRFVRREFAHSFIKPSAKNHLKITVRAKAPAFEPDALFSERVGESTSSTPGEFGQAAQQVDAKQAFRDRREQDLFEMAEQERINGRADAAGRYLAQMDEGYWSALGYLNLANDFARNDLNSTRALVSLRVAMAMAAKDNNQTRRNNLLDQLHLRAGYLALKSDEHDKATNLLEKVRLDSYYAPQALYLHGLALANKGNHRAAMQSWHRAKKFPLAFPGVTDAWIGMGRGYDMAGYPGQAGESWLAANAAYQGERVTLKELAQRIKQHGAYKALVEDARNTGSEWFLADSRTLTQPRMAYLLTFLEAANAQEAVRTVALLDEMTSQLNRNAHDLSVFVVALTDLLNSGNTASSLKVMLSESKHLKQRIHGLLAQVKAERTRAAQTLDRLALDFVENQYQLMGHALDKTEQQIAHLYEYLALETLGEGEQ